MKYGGVPKIDQGTRESLFMRQEEKRDTLRGTPGMWVKNEPFKPVYIPGWMVLSEAQMKQWESENSGPMLVQTGPFWR